MIKASRILGAALLLFLAACSHAAPAQPFMLNDNTEGWRIVCGGWFLGTNDCFEKADYVCMSQGYTLLKETDITPPESTYVWNEADAHEIVVRCNGANVRP